MFGWEFRPDLRRGLRSGDASYHQGFVMKSRGRFICRANPVFLSLLTMLPVLSAGAQEPLLTLDRLKARRLDPQSRGPVLILQKEEGLVILNASTGNEIGRFDGTNLMTATSADGAWVAVGSAVGSVRVWSTSTGKSRDPVVIGPYFMEFSPSGKALLIASLDGSVVLWNPESASEIFHTSGAPISSVAILEGWRTMAAGNRDGTITLWDLQKGIPIFSFPAHRDRVTDLLYLPAMHRFASLGEDGTAKIWYSDLEEFLSHTSEEYRKKAEEYQKRAEELDKRARGLSGNRASTPEDKKAPAGAKGNGGKKRK